jgi:hypothetical protein
MSKRFKDLRIGDHVFIVKPDKDCPKMTEAVVNRNPTYRDQENVYFSVTTIRGKNTLDIPWIPAEKSYHENNIMSISTNRERAVSFHKKNLKELLDKSSNIITREMMVSGEILDEMRRTEKIRHEDKK